MSTVRLPAMLRPLAEGADEVVVQAPTVAGVLAQLVERHPRLRRHLFDEQGRLRGYVNVYVNDEDVRQRGGDSATVGHDDVLTIVPSVAGGDSVPRAELSVSELGRYSRHIALSEVGVEGQQRLKNARVLIVGAGGLGSPAALYLGAAGVGHISIIDYDVVEASNLQRQVLFRSEHVGQSKAQLAAIE